MIKFIKTMALVLWIPAILLVVSIVYSNMNSDIGYSPVQPVQFSHKVHSGDYKIKCLFCHHEAETGSFSAVPTTFACMVCHVALKSETEPMKPVIESYDNNKPIKWIRIHKLPEYVKFNHNTHILADIDCASCHGNVETMEQTYKTKDFTMSWCLDCHRNPAEYIIRGRDITGIFTFGNAKNNDKSMLKQKVYTKPAYGGYVGNKVYEKYGIKSAKAPGKGPEFCSACHY
jgi:hypothetical protein